MGTDLGVGVSRNDEPASRRGPDLRLVALVTGATLIGVALQSRYALVTIVLDGLSAALVLVPAMLAGLWIVALFRFGQMPLRWHILLGAVLGLGAMSLLVLLAGLAGLLQRGLWISILVACGTLGVLRLRTLLATATAEKSTSPLGGVGSAKSAWPLLWLLACPFLILAAVAATHAPGFLRVEEGSGYDVLEYHLQLPKEYVHAGRIDYIPHNVYANFPANVEMQYLLTMIVLGDVHDVGTVANTIHLVFAMLSVFAAWVIGREWSPRAGVICAVMTASTGWLTYLCGLAFVENAVLLFGFVAVGCLVRSSPGGAAAGDDTRGKPPKYTSHSRRWIVSAGIAAGLACGCKYTAVAMIAAPLALAAFFLTAGTTRRKLAGAATFAMATLVTFSPWLIKNQIMTGNPVFPLAGGVFDASPEGWGAAQSEQWNRGHSVGPDGQSLGARLGALWTATVVDRDQRLGPALLIIGLLGLVGRRRSRADWMLVSFAACQVLIWLFATHLFARFLITALIPLSLLCGRSLGEDARPPRVRLVTVALIAGCAWNFLFAAKLHGRESVGGVPASLAYDGRTDRDAYLGVVNNELPTSAKILLVGDARAFYFKRETYYCVAFNRNPFFEAIRAGASADDLLDWLRGRGYTHVLVNWSEVRRIVVTYGFSPPVGHEELAETFERLTDAGIQRMRAFPHPQGGGRYIDLYSVPR